MVNYLRLKYPEQSGGPAAALSDLSIRYPLSQRKNAKSLQLKCLYIRIRIF